MSVSIDVSFKQKHFTHDKDIVNGNVEMLKYTNFTMSYFPPPKEWELTIFNVFGKMGSGKTTFAKKCARRIIKIFRDAGYECEIYQTNDLINLIDYLAKPENIPNRKRVLIVLLDDTMNLSGLNSLNTFSQSNKNMEKALAYFRHMIDKDSFGNTPEHIRTGACFVFYMCQDVHRLGTFIRRVAIMNIFKSWYPEIEHELSYEQNKYLRQITEWSDQHIYSARAFSFAITTNKTGMKLFYPLESEDEQIEIPVVNPRNERLERKFAELIETLEQVYNEKMKGKIFTAYIEHWGEMNQIDICKEDIAKIEKKIIYWYNYESDAPKSPPKPYIRKDRVKHRVNHPRFPKVLDLNTEQIIEVKSERV